MIDLISPRQQSLLTSPRWQWLDEYLRLWCARPLEAADGCSPEELAGVSARLGVVLPAVLAEWFELVGHRLEAVQDAPATPQMTRVSDGLLAVWTENQGVWTLLAGEGVDPLCQIDTSDFSFEPAPLSQTLHGMLLSDTLVGAWAGEGRGPLGELAPSVAGGVIEDATQEELARVLGAFPALDVPGNPFNGVPPHGSGAVVLREGIGLEWAVATAQDFGRIDALVPLEPAGGVYRVQVELPIAEARRMGMIQSSGAPDLDAIHVGSREFAKPVMGRADRQSVSVEWETVQPEACLSALRDALSEATRALAVISYRPERVARWRLVEGA